ncbi:hypothetical protein Vretimale_13708, partial [Volvox reticuliferus]
LLVHRLDDRDSHFLVVGPVVLDYLSELLGFIRSLGQEKIIARVARLIHQGHNTLVGDVNDRVLLPGNVGNLDVMRRWRHLLILLASEDINSNEVALCVAVLARLGGRDVHHLARPA